MHARDGAQLALLARDGEELQRAAADLLRFEVQVSTWPCDVLEARQVERTFSSIAEKYGRIDVLVNKAGIMLVAPLEAMAKEDFEEAMQVHFWAPYHVTMAALPYLKRNPESRIVNISSIGGRVAVQCSPGLPPGPDSVKVKSESDRLLEKRNLDRP